MTLSRHDDDPELVPPPELMRLRAILGRPPTHATRARHLAAATSAARESTGTGRRLARRTARAAVAVVASLAITSGLAAAQVLPQPAQRFFTSVSDRLYPSTPSVPSTTVTDPEVDAGGSPTTRPEGDGGAPAPTADDASPATTAAPTGRSPGGATSPTSLVTLPGPTTTIPGPGGPGSPDDPTDPGTDGGSGEPTDPPTTTTTTTTPETDGGTTDAGTADVTTTTTPTGSGQGGSD